MSHSGSDKLVNSVFYAETYHPIQAGSIDGTDFLPHDNAVYRAHLCSSASLYDPLGDPNLLGDPYCTLFVARLSHHTTDHTLRKAMRKYGRVKNLRLVRHIVTGASRGYAFVEFETEREMRRAYKEYFGWGNCQSLYATLSTSEEENLEIFWHGLKLDAHHSIVDDCEIIVDYNRQQLMPGWIPRRLGGGLGGKKESGQLRFGGRERPFRAPLRPIPYEDLKRLGIPPPLEGKYMSRHQIPSPPGRGRSLEDIEEGSLRSRSMDRDGKACKSIPAGSRKRRSVDDQEKRSNRSSVEEGKGYIERTSMERDGSSISVQREEHHYKRKSMDKEDRSHRRGYKDRDEKHSSRRHESGRRE